MRVKTTDSNDVNALALQGIEGVRVADTNAQQPLKQPDTTRIGEGLSGNDGKGYEVSRVRRGAQEIKRIQSLPKETEVKKGAIVQADMFSGRIAAEAVNAAGATQPLELRTSEKAMSLYLKGLTLNESFDFSLFGPRANQIYVAAVAWDLSGRPPVVFPPAQLDGQGNPTYALRPLEKATFIGDGLQLWPSTQVVGGLNVQLIVMESDGDVRKLGETLEAVRKSVQDSSLINLLAALASGPTAGAVTAALNAGAALTGVISQVLQANGDDLVGVFQGTYGAELMHQSQNEHYDQRGASIDLAFHAL